MLAITNHRQERRERIKLRGFTTMSHMWGRSSPTKQIMLQSSVNGDIGLIQSLLALDPVALESTNCYGLSTLQLAIIHRHFRLAEYLVHAGINILLRDNFGWTALHDAALYSSSTLVEILLQYGSNILATNQKGEMPIDIAGDVAMETLLCEKMAEAGHEEIAMKYREKFGIISTSDSDGIFADKSNQDFGNGDSDSFENCFRVEGDCGCPEAAVMNIDPYSPDRPGEANPGDHAHHSKSDYAAATRPPTRRPQRYISSLFSLPENSEENNTSPGHRSQLSSSPRRRVTSPVLKRKAGVSGIESPSRRRHMQQADTAPSVAAAAADNTISTFSSSLCRSASFDAGRRRTSPPCRTFGKLTSSTSDLEMRLTAEETRQRAAAKANGASPSSSETRETPIELLKMRPRKPSIVDVTARKRSREGEPELSRAAGAGSRRSVSFQPEVLLQEIVTEGDADKVKEMIISGLVDDLNKMSPVGLTALHQCALDGNLECARTLVLNGADVNCMDVDGWSPLHAAAANGHMDAVRFLLKNGANPVLRNEQGQTPYDVAKKSNIRRILFRAASGKTLDPMEDDVSDGEFSSEEEEYSHAESDSDDAELCFSDDSESSPWNNKLLLLKRSGANTSSPRPGSQRDSSNRGDSVFSGYRDPASISAALMKERELSDSTSSYGSMSEQDLNLSRHEIADVDGSETSSVRTLTVDEEELTDTDRETDQGFSTMDISSDSSNRRFHFSDDEGTSHDVLDIDLEPGSLDYKYQESVLNSDVDSLLKLVKHKSEIDVNRVNKTSGVSALHHAVLEENYALVKHLVCDFKCDVNLKDIEGWTPLHAASAVGSIRIAQFLLENGAKASILNNNCEFPVDVTDEESMSDLLKKAMLGPSVGKMFKGIFR